MSVACNRFEAFASMSAANLLETEPSLSPDPNIAAKIVVRRPDGATVNMDITPVDLTPQPPTAATCFADVVDTQGLPMAYETACTALPLEGSDADAMDQVPGKPLRPTLS